MVDNKRRQRTDSTELLNKLASQLTALTKQVEDVKALPVGMPEDVELHLASYQKQLTDLNKRMESLQRSTVGTKEYETAMAQATASMKSMAEIAAALPVAIQRQHEGLQKSVTGIVAPLTSMGDLLKTVLELVEGPLSLSDDAVERLSVSVEKRLSPMVLDHLKTTMDRTFSRYERSFKKMVDDGVEGVARERKRLETATAHTVTEVDRLDERLEDRTVSVVSIVLLVTVLGVGVIVVAGGLWMGASLLGIPAAVPEMWSRAWAADTWWSGVGWALGAVVLMCVTIAAIAAAAVWVGRRWPVEDYKALLRRNR